MQVIDNLTARPITSESERAEMLAIIKRMQEDALKEEDVLDTARDQVENQKGISTFVEGRIYKAIFFLDRTTKTLRKTWYQHCVG